MQGKGSRIQINKLCIKTGNIGCESTKANRSVIFSTFSQGDSPIFLANTSKAAEFNFRHSLRFKNPMKTMKKSVKVVEFPYDRSFTKTRKQSKTFFSMYKDNIRKSYTRKQLFCQFEGCKDNKKFSHHSSRVNSISRNSKKFEGYQKIAQGDFDSNCLTINRLTSLNKTQQRMRNLKISPVLLRDEKEDPDYLFFKNKLISEYLAENPIK